MASDGIFSSLMSLSGVTKCPLKETTGDQRYILDYLTEEVLQRLPPDVQTFLLSTCVLERLSASLGDAVTQQQGSQQILERLEQANLFIVSLDNRRQWYRYHALFAEALYYQLEQLHPDQVPLLHYRASLWYAEHDQTIQAIIHAFRASHWQWAADLIERKVHLLMSQAWGASQHELVMFRQWLQQLPAEVVNARPRLCVACALLLWQVAPQPTVEAWLDTAEAMLTTAQGPDSSTVPTVAKEDQADLLAEELAWRAFLRCHVRDGHIALSLCQQALSLLSLENYHVRAIVEWVRFRTLYICSANDAAAAVESGLQASSLAQTAGLRALAIVILGTTTAYMVGTGQLREALRLTQQAMQWARTPGELMAPYVGYPALFQADILREWNQLDGLPTFVSDSIELCKQTESMSLLIHLIYGYGILLRVHLTRGELNAACSALQEIEHIGMGMNQHLYLHVRSIFTTVDQVRLWLACGELDRAMFWVKELDRGEKLGTPFEHERQEVARARIFLAQEQPIQALEQLDSALHRATAGKRRGHIIAGLFGLPVLPI
jgi:LuxR family maltose regulon positive regulatory protein